jgi:oxygen-independent coproporphyrinogen-3 oxidase
LLPTRELAAMLDAVRATWGVAPGAEVTVEANPDTVDARVVRDLAAAGATRLSLGMQSAVPEVLATLDRTHTPAHVPRAVDAAHAAGMEASVDLIYGTPGETVADWEASLRAAVGTGIGHVSAYALTLEPHTPLARRIARGQAPPIDPDAQAEKYEVADALLAAAGLTWYEISNFARGPAQRSRHNLGYWRGADWWGVGPGAHSALATPVPTRWWNTKRPQEWAARLAEGRSPEAGREVLDAEAQAVERLMLGIRLAEGLPVEDVPEAGRGAIAALVADGLAEREAAANGRVVLTLRGRLLADTATRALAGWRP